MKKIAIGVLFVLAAGVIFAQSGSMIVDIGLFAVDIDTPETLVRTIKYDRAGKELVKEQGLADVIGAIAYKSACLKKLNSAGNLVHACVLHGSCYYSVYLWFYDDDTEESNIGCSFLCFRW